MSICEITCRITNISNTLFPYDHTPPFLYTTNTFILTGVVMGTQGTVIVSSALNSSNCGDNMQNNHRTMNVSTKHNTFTTLSKYVHNTGTFVNVTTYCGYMVKDSGIPEYAMVFLLRPFDKYRQLRYLRFTVILAVFTVCTGRAAYES